MAISVQNLTKQFGSFLAVDNVSLEIPADSLTALLGPSGSGKSTLLRIIAGLERPDSGEVWLVGENSTYRSVQERGIGFLFQHYALFKHLTVRENIAFGMELRKLARSRIRSRVDDLLDLIQLTGLADRYPSQLSGGQRQRVALARALAVQPKVLLLDEPFGALDAKVRKELRTWLRNLHNEVRVTTVIVTHDQEEAMEVADQIVVMNRGRVEQVGTATEIYDQPASAFVMGFVGAVNVLPANAGILPQGKQVEGDRVFLRPHDIQIEPFQVDDAIPAAVNRVTYLGWEVQVELLLRSGQAVTALLNREDYHRLQLARHQHVFIRPKQVRTFPPEYALN